MASCGCHDFDFTDINLDDDWDAEVPGGVDESMLALENAALEEVLVVGPPDPENEECRMEFTEDWREELETLLNGPDLIVTSKWTLMMESDENSLSIATTSKHQKKQCHICFLQTQSSRNQQPFAMVWLPMSCMLGVSDSSAANLPLQLASKGR